MTTALAKLPPSDAISRVTIKDTKYERIYRVDGEKLWWWQYQHYTIRRWYWRGIWFWSREIYREDRPMRDFIRSRCGS